MKYCNADMYAGDTTFYLSGHNVSELNSKLNNEIKIISDWCDTNKMVINTKKTKCMLVTTRYKHSQLCNSGEGLNIIFDDNQLQQVQKEKLLGVWIDDKLNWEHHINEMCKLIGARLALFRRIRSYLDVTTCKLYYNGIYIYITIGGLL